jgi:amino acid transporter
MVKTVCLANSQIAESATPNLGNAFGTGDGGNSDPLDSVANTAGYNTNETSIDAVIQSIIEVALSFLGVFFLVLMIYGGYEWLTARGNSDQVQKAQSIIKNAIIGLMIVAAAYAISYFVMSIFAGNTLS